MAKKNEVVTDWNNLPLMLSVKDLKRILNINLNSVYELAHQKQFPSIKIGRRYVIPKQGFKNWLQQQTKN